VAAGEGEGSSQRGKELEGAHPELGYQAEPGGPGRTSCRGCRQGGGPTSGSEKNGETCEPGAADLS
jgi:hypothetical protein